MLSGEVHCVFVLCRYETKLAAEVEVGLRLRGENGIMKKKFGALQQQIDEHQQKTQQLHEHEQELQNVCFTFLDFLSKF